jgi:hypothetical protein
MGCGASAKSKDKYSTDATTETSQEQTKQPASNGQAASSSSKATAGSGESLSEGTRVRIEGLTGAVELNGKVGVVRSLNESSGRYVVEIDGGEQKSLKRDNLIVANAPTIVSANTKKSVQSESSTTAQAQPANKGSDPPSKTSKDTQAKKEAERKSSVKASKKADTPNGAVNLGEFTCGDRVRVGGLNGAIDLNGKLAVVFGLDKATGRYVVQFENGAGQKKLKADNLTAMGTATGPLAAEARMFAAMNGG